MLNIEEPKLKYVLPNVSAITIPEYGFVPYADINDAIRISDARVEEMKKMKKKVCIDKIIRNGDATIVFWADGEKTIVKRAEGESDSLYTAVTAALAKKVYGNNSKFKKMIEKKVVVQEKKEKK